jgi:hypothetical protein
MAYIYNLLNGDPALKSDNVKASIRALELLRNFYPHDQDGPDALENAIPDMFIKDERLAIVIKSGTTESVDCVDENGKLLMRLNIADFGGGLSNVDVIFKPREVSTNLVKSWFNGDRIYDVKIKAQLVSVSLFLEKENNDGPKTI